MEKEISNGAMLGIVLIALAAIIGLGFGVFAIAKGTANEGVTNVQENLGAVGNSAFTDYDQKIVTGTQVLSALQNFEGKPVALIVATNATKDKAVQGTMSDGAGVAQAYAKKGSAVPGVVAYSNNTLGTAYVMSGKTTAGVGGNILKDAGAFVNYNALLSGTLIDTGTNKGDYINSGGKIYFDNNCFRTTNGFQVDSGKVQFNAITGNTSKSGLMEYIPTGARFQAYLIKDESGTIMGIAFEQLSNN